MVTIAVGPALPGIGSWEWLGAALAAAIQSRHQVKVFRDRVPECDACLLIKWPPERENVAELAARQPLVFCPVDFYGSCADIDRQAAFLTRCAGIVVHCEPLRKYFQSYAPVEYIDHPVKYVAPPRETDSAAGAILWVGVTSNLPPLVEWANGTELPHELWVLTNLPGETDELPAAELGFREHNLVRVGKWNPARHVDWASGARWAVDIKGDDFRARHKPPSKAIDFLASGLPLAVNRGHSAERHLSRLGFQLADVNDRQRWFSDDYRKTTLEFGSQLRDRLSPQRVGERMLEILDRVLIERTAA